ncbi:MAG TPA: ATP-dependent DNA helicase RecQ [Rectinemataceae bacterium]|nr:ATP-dependent DNA helicase RecQ [Rectinemataceae bacterium]
MADKGDPGLFEEEEGGLGDRMASADSVLREVFGFPGWRPYQREIVAAVLSGRDTLAVLPTGGGKSLAYQIPALIFGSEGSSSGPVLVVSPLIALMKDQLAGLEEIGIPAVALNSSLDPQTWRAKAAELLSGRARLLYAAPESLSSPRLLELLDSRPPALVAVDEAHCISQWGHDFRPDYRRIAEIPRRFPGTPLLAVTATATKPVRDDIVGSLGLRKPAIFVASFDRPNLRIEVRPKRNALAELVAYASARPESSGIVYRMSRAAAEDTAASLRAAGISALPYHAGLSSAERERNQEAFIRDDVRVIAATVAFGMGVDKPDVRWVAHLDLPKSLESYYQEIGRAGRDGLPADCILFFSHGDATKMLRLIESPRSFQAPDEETVGDGERLAAERERLWKMVRYAESPLCRRGQILNHFGETAKRDCATAGGLPCDVCSTGGSSLVDLGTEALKLLSCVARLGGLRRGPGEEAPFGYGGFGSGHVADVLRGEETDNVRRFGHARLSTFGIGKDLTRAAWMELARRLETAGLVEQAPEFRTLRLTDLAFDYFKTKGPFITPPLPTTDGRGRKAASKTGAGERTAKARLLKKGSAEAIAASAGGSEGLEGSARALFEKLRRWRKTVADEAGVPPYVVFADRTLRELALARPRNRAALSEVFGIGARKLERYGDLLLAEIEGE